MGCVAPSARVEARGLRGSVQAREVRGEGREREREKDPSSVLLCLFTALTRTQATQAAGQAAA